MDASQDSSLTSFFHQLPKKSDATVRFFNRTDFYCVLGEDANFVAKEVFKSSSNIKLIGSQKTELLNLNKNQFETLIKDLLLVRKYRVEIYCKKNNDWSLEYKGSPGYISQFEDILFDSEAPTGTTLMAIKTSGDSKSKIIGVATLDVSDRLMRVCQFSDDENHTELEGVIVQLAPKEILLPDSTEYKNIIKVGSRCGALITTRKSNEFTNDGLGQDLNRLLEWKAGQAQNSLALAEMKLTVANQGLKALIKYSELLSSETDFNQYSLNTFEPENYVYVDSSAAKALGLISIPGQQSLINFLDKCRTPQGHRLIGQWVKKPLRDLRKIAERQQVVAALIDDAELRMNLYEEHLRYFPDLQFLARKLQRKNASMHDCYKIYQAVSKIPPLLQLLKSAEYCAAIKDEFISILEELNTEMEKYQEMIASTLDLELVSKGEYLVQAEFSEDLQELRCKLDELEKEIQNELTKAGRDLSLEVGKGVKLESNAQFGYYFRITNKKEEKQIRNHPKYKMIDCTKAFIRFQSLNLESLNKEYLETKSQYDECQKSIVEEILNVAVGYVGSLLAINNVIAKLDVLTSLSLIASNAPIPYIKPTMLPSDDRLFQLKQARHPMLEVQDSMSFIPNDVYMGKDEHTFFIITGPNMGGKSTYIRTAGVISLLAHIGSFVPCEEAKISIIDSILARIGAGDCMLTGVSTFMNEMVETSSILKRATKYSLVMIDELGRGTSTYEGCGLAWAIASHLADEVKCFSLFATHFQELTVLPNSVASAANYHVTASTTDSDCLTMLYQVAPGPSDRSFGLEVAHMVRFQDHIIENARKKQTQLEQRQAMSLKGQNFTAEEIEEGEALVTEFLTQLKLRGPESIQILKNELLSKNKNYVSALLCEN